MQHGVVVMNMIVTRLLYIVSFVSLHMAKDVQLEHADLKVYFTEKSKKIYLDADTTVYACQRAHACKGECTYSVCLSCYQEELGGDGRASRSKNKKKEEEEKEKLGEGVEGSVTKQSLKASSCHHLMTHLGMFQNPWWCKKIDAGTDKTVGFGTVRWFESIHGCYKCKGIYFLGTEKQYEGYEFPKVEEMHKVVADEYKKRIVPKKLNMDD